MYENVYVDIAEGIGMIQINREQVRNALDTLTLKEIENALEELEANQEVGVIAITGQGEKIFASGADIKQLRERKMLEALLPGIQSTYKKIENCTKATIAVINGFALGGGFELALSCDIRIAADHAKVGLPELNLGIIPGAGGTQRLSRIVGKGRALDMILTGKVLDGKEAERVGIVSKAVPYQALWSAVKETAGQIMLKGPVAVRLAKMVINRGYDTDIDTALMLEKLAQTVAFGTEDKNEGTQAFLDKRKTKFSNK